MMTAATFEAIETMLRGAQVDYRVHVHPPVVTVEEARELAPDLVGRLLKTVAFRVADESWVLAATRAADRVHYKQLADALGCNRRALRLVPAETVAAELGFEVGGVGPFPVRDGIRILFDAGTRTLGHVVCGAGVRDRSFELPLPDLLRVSGGEFRDLVR